MWLCARFFTIEQHLIDVLWNASLSKEYLKIYLLVFSLHFRRMLYYIFYINYSMLKVCLFIGILSLFLYYYFFVLFFSFLFLFLFHFMVFFSFRFFFLIFYLFFFSGLTNKEFGSLPVRYIAMFRYLIYIYNSVSVIKWRHKIPEQFRNHRNRGEIDTHMTAHFPGLVQVFQ